MGLSIINSLYKQEKVDRTQVESVAKNVISEVLFDIAQQANFEAIHKSRNIARMLSI
ncbi:MAG: hypothetical protein HC917_10170 [Richelia sp. SM2_1_7]|nr:hypothetical protein [Richelia sp. SM2_1_7]